MELWILFGTFTFLLLIGTPVAFCLGVSSFATVLYMGLPPVVVFQRLNSGVSVFALMAIPFFIYAGELMVRGDIARRLVALAGGLVGHLRGGLGQVNITASVLFGGISGSAAADAGRHPFGHHFDDRAGGRAGLADGIQVCLPFPHRLGHQQ